MPFRTLFGRLRERDWAGVFVELVIVVVGVFLGLQASNWNQARQDSARGAEYLEHIRDDLDYEIELLRKTLVFSRQVAAYGDAAIAYAETGTLYQQSAWKTLLAYYQASQVWPFRQPNTTFDELRGSGELQLIRNPALRTRLVGHYGDNAGSHVIEVLGVIPKYREDVRGLTPWSVQRYIWTHCHRTDSRVGQELLDCPAPIGESEANAVIESFRKNETLTAELRFWMTSVNTSLVILDVVRRTAERVAADVKAELQRSKP
jgi:hypothetical protein